MGIVNTNTLVLRVARNPSAPLRIMVGALKKERFVPASSRDVTLDAIHAVGLYASVANSEGKLRIKLGGKSYELRVTEIPEEPAAEDAKTDGQPT